jgi:hypothetical protein
MSNTAILKTSISSEQAVARLSDTQRIELATSTVPPVTDPIQIDALLKSSLKDIKLPSFDNSRMTIGELCTMDKLIVLWGHSNELEKTDSMFDRLTREVIKTINKKNAFLIPHTGEIAVAVFSHLLAGFSAHLLHPDADQVCNAMRTKGAQFEASYRWYTTNKTESYGALADVVTWLKERAK